MKRSTHLKLKQLRVILVAWMIAGFFMSVYEWLTLDSDVSAGFSSNYSFAVAVIKNMSAGLIGGLIGGSFLVFYVNVRYQDKPYAYTIISVIVMFILVVALISFLMGLIIAPMRTGLPLSHPATVAAMKAFLQDSSHYKAALGWCFVVGTTQLLLQVASKFGPAVFWNIMRGKYNRPKEERRIFMFLDINSSTTIAEQLGNEKYHALLKDFFADITTPILENGGNIYQYVGDEVVIAWDYESGIKDQHCIRCFFDMKQFIQQQREKYQQRYGLVPSFKAGIHCGQVVAGEVGIIKRDITYSGDVLNTTSRILGKCGELREEVIASSELLAQFHSLAAFVSRPLGGILLRGKGKEVLLNALSPVAV